MDARTDSRRLQLHVMCCATMCCPVAQSATEELERLEHAFDSVKKQLFDRLHGILREQLFHDTTAGAVGPAPAATLTAPTTSAKLLDRSTADVLNGAAANGASVQSL